MIIKTNKNLLALLWSYMFVLFAIGLGGQSNGLDIEAQEAMLLGSILLVPLGFISRSSIEHEQQIVTHKNWRDKKTFSVRIQDIQKIDIKKQRKGSSWMIIYTQKERFFFRISFFRQSQIVILLKEIQTLKPSIEFSKNLQDYIQLHNDKKIENLIQKIIVGISLLFTCMGCIILYNSLISL